MVLREKAVTQFHQQYIYRESAFLQQQRCILTPCKSAKQHLCDELALFASICVEAVLDSNGLKEAKVCH